MDNQRLIIWSFFGFMCILTYQAWTIDSTQNEIIVEQAYEENELSFEATPQLTNNLPKLSQPNSNNVTPVIISDNDFSKIITITTDVLELKINSKGGTIEAVSYTHLRAHET